MFSRLGLPNMLYYVYILASGRYGTLYIGITNNLALRLEQHRMGRGSEFVRNTVCTGLYTWRPMKPRWRRFPARSS
jgi:predicted GIY-YIG superfamily endonuclease